MTLFVDRRLLAGSFPERVLTDLRDIVNCDDGFDEVPDSIRDAAGMESPVTRIVYSKTESGFGQDLVDYLVNGTPRFIIVSGLNSEATVDMGGENLLRLLAGFTFCSGDWIQIFYDTTQRMTARPYYNIGVDGQHLPLPNCMLLGRELARARLIANGSFPCPGQGTDQQFDAYLTQSANDENSLRSQYGCRLRGINAHQTFSELNGDPPFQGNPNECECGGGCFIVTAATGTPRSTEVSHLKELRDRLLRHTNLGAAFYHGIFAEYLRISQRIIADMKACPAFAAAVRRFVVNPFVEYYSIFGEYAGGGWRDGDFEQRIESRLSQFEADLSREGLDTAQHALVAREFGRFHRQLRHAHGEVRGALPWPVPPSHGDVQTLVSYLLGVAKASGDGTSYLTWAIAAPLYHYWIAVALLRRGARSGVGAGAYLHHALIKWFGTIPLSRELLDRVAGSVGWDLSRLAETVLKPLTLRRMFGARVVWALGGNLPSDLRQTLKTLEYVGPAELK